jgi:hypothetical protein
LDSKIMTAPGGQPNTFSFKGERQVPRSVSQRIQLAMGAAMAGFGAAAVVAPERFTQSSVEDAANCENLTRMWALREVALAAIMLSTSASQSRKAIMGAVTALAAAEVVVSLLTPALSGASRTGAVGTAALSGAAAGYAWRTA